MPSHISRINSQLYRSTTRITSFKSFSRLLSLFLPLPLSRFFSLHLHNMEDALPVLVVGGGISGLALGIALLRMGVDVVVFDKVRSPFLSLPSSAVVLKILLGVALSLLLSIFPPSLPLIPLVHRCTPLPRLLSARPVPSPFSLPSLPVCRSPPLLPSLRRGHSASRLSRLICTSPFALRCRRCAMQARA